MVILVVSGARLAWNQLSTSATARAKAFGPPKVTAEVNEAHGQPAGYHNGTVVYAASRKNFYTAEERSAVITAALSRPSDLGLPFASWTLDRLVAHLGELAETRSVCGWGIGVKRSRISEVLHAEGLKWRQEETWFGARVDPEFTQKRGPSSSSTPRRPRAASSSASTKWDCLPARATPASA